MLNRENRQEKTDESPIYTFSDEVTKKKIRRHIKDPNDVITAKDIENAKVPGAEDEATPVKRAKKSKKGKDTNVVTDTPGKPSTPWDVLQE